MFLGDVTAEWGGFGMALAAPARSPSARSVRRIPVIARCRLRSQTTQQQSANPGHLGAERTDMDAANVLIITPTAGWRSAASGLETWTRGVLAGWLLVIGTTLECETRSARALRTIRRERAK